MFGHWFPDKVNASNTRKVEDDSRSPTDFTPDPEPPAASDVQKATNTLLKSPHDAVISQIESEAQELQVAGTSLGTSAHSPSSMAPLERTSTTGLRRRVLPENMYDPFDGQSIGLMVPGEFSEAEDDVWSHLAQIRNLQSDIARMHAQMERLGETDRFGVSQGFEDEGINVEEEAKAAKAAEFAKLSDRFGGRKDAIDAIMEKIGTLSRSINEFHSLRTPIFRSSTDCNNIPEPENDPNASAFSTMTELPEREHIAPRKRILQDSLKDSPVSFTNSLVDRADL